MSTNLEIRDMLEGLRAKDPAAAAALYREYRPIVEDVVRRLPGTKMGRTTSVSDLVQSGMIKILTHFAALLADVDDFPGYFREMARNSHRSRFRRMTAQKRDVYKEVYDDGTLAAAAQSGESASGVVGLAEEYEFLLGPLSVADRDLVELRLEGYSFNDIARLADLPSAEAARKRFERILDRLRKQHAPGTDP